MDPSSPTLKKSLQAAVRFIADDYLRDPNVTSVGIGFKTVKGQRTDQLAFQFTVRQKLPSEAFAPLTRPIPTELSAGGVTFPTDVLSRVFAPHPVAVEVAEKSKRKQRLDPMMPGISIGHFASGGGTLGCLVRDAGTDEVQMLSNWHVLGSATAQPGDPIVQPCLTDDNRVDRNHAGVLVRSHLGLAGDCALARPVGRAVEELVLELDVVVRRIGDPALDDVVVKSGRTSGVTYGRVTRLHVITKLDYDEVGETRIGGFEIGPDPDHPAVGGEITVAGDSGSVWLAVDEEGRTTDMMLGLHYSGEQIEPAEWASACYASAVFEKLEILPLDAPPTQMAADGAPEGLSLVVARAGYDANFLAGFTVPVPVAIGIELEYASTRSGAAVRHCTHFSVAMSKSRRFARWVAWNVDGASTKRLSSRGSDFVLDADYDDERQVGPELYASSRLDPGPIARRADLVWGSRAEAEQASRDSFFVTNVTPRLHGLDRHLWEALVDAIFEHASVDDLRISLVGGPIFAPDDAVQEGIAVPGSHFKVAAWVEDGTAVAAAFVVTQDHLETGVEAVGPEAFSVYQVPVAWLGEKTELDFGVLAAHDMMGAAVRRIDTPEDYIKKA